jgi:hypothetical protein
MTSHILVVLPFDLDARQFAQTILYPGFEFAGLVELYPLGIPAKHWVFKNCQQFGDSGIDLTH